MYVKVEEVRTCKLFTHQLRHGKYEVMTNDLDKHEVMLLPLLLIVCIYFLFHLHFAFMVFSGFVLFFVIVVNSSSQVIWDQQLISGSPEPWILSLSIFSPSLSIFFFFSSLPSG